MNKTKPDSQTSSLNVEVLALNELKPFKKNARKHPAENVKKLAVSLKTYGWTTPVLITDEKEVIAGHGRILAAKSLKIKEVPCIRLSHLTPQAVAAYRLADNRLALDSEWDAPLLIEAIKELHLDGFDVELSGFNQLEIESFLALAGDDPRDEWLGMPEYNSENKLSYRAILIHFENQKDVDDFAALTGLHITKETSSAWFPFRERKVFKDKRYMQIMKQ